MATDLRSQSGGPGDDNLAEAVTAPAEDARAEWWSGRAPLVALLAFVNVPIAVATVRALARGWLPLGDNGILLVRARDVGTSHHPLLGSWTSASALVGKQFNNPGPLYSDALAPTVRLLGPWVGLAVGVMLVNIAASSLAVVAARRISGAESMVAIGLVVVGLQYAMGSELLFDVWQPNALLLPCLAFLVVATVLAAGDLTMAVGDRRGQHARADPPESGGGRGGRGNRRARDGRLSLAARNPQRGRY